MSDGTAHPVDPDDWQWQREAACQGMPSDTFFPTEGDTKRKHDRARTICANCSVFLECLEFATFTMPQEHGMWAGATEDERRELREGTLTPDEILWLCGQAKTATMGA
jgi:WhiB family redox-sensing transcriptional regulator